MNDRCSIKEPPPGTPALGLDRLVLSIGTSDFVPALRQSMHNVARVDQCMVVIFRPGQETENTLALGNMDYRHALGLGNAYADEYHNADPNKPIIFRDGREGAPVLLRFADAKKYRRDYMKKFFYDSGICDKFAVAYWQDDFCVYSNFYRLDPSGKLSSDDIGRLTVVGPLVAAAIARHYGEQRAAPAKEVNTAVALERFFSETPPFSMLSSREKEICTGILTGCTSEAIAYDLGIGINTVLTYRKRAYARLGVVSANELFALFIRRGGPQYMPPDRLRSARAN